MADVLPARSAERQPFPCHSQRRRIRREERLQVASVEAPFGEAWRAEALQMESEPGDMCGGFGSLAQQGFPARFPGRSAYRQIKYTSAGMQEGAASPFLSHPQRRRVRREERLQAASAIMFRPCASRTGT